MDREISYTDAKRRFPKQVKDALADLRRGKSKDKDMAPKDMKWGYGWGVEVRAHSFKELLDGTAQKHQAKKDAMTLEESVADEVKRIRGLGLWCKAGRGIGRSRLPMPVPDELVEEIRKRHEAARAQQEKADKLTPEEREKEVRRLLGSLGPGLFGLGFCPDKSGSITREMIEEQPKDPLKALGDALRVDGAQDIKVSETKADDLKGVPTIDLTNKTQQIRDFFAQQHEGDKQYLRNMLANIPPGVPQIAIDAVRNTLNELEQNGVPQVVVEEGKVTKHTVEELLDADDDKLAKLAENFSAHARKKLKDGNGHGA